MPVIPQRRTWTDYMGLALSAVDLNAMEADIANAVPNWQPNTSYVAGQPIVNPNADVQTRISSGTSATTWAADSTNWSYTSNFEHVVIPTGLVGGQDSTAAIQNAATKAQNDGVPLVIPKAANGLAYKMSSTLQLWSGARIIGRGGVIDFQTDHSATGIGLFIGNASTGVGVNDVQVIGLEVISSNATARNGVYGLVSLFGSGNVLLQDVQIGNTTAKSGGESTGIFTMNCSDLRIIRPYVQNTLADGIHLSRQTVRAVVDHPIVIGAQDDGIGVVSNKQDGSGPIYGPCQYVQIIQPVVVNSTVAGSGVSLVGAQDCTVIGGSVDTVPNRIFAISQANYGGIISPARNTIHGIVGKNAQSTVAAIVANADRTTIIGCEISGGPGGLQVLGSTRTKISGCGIASTADQPAVYEDSASSRTLINGCDLSANGAQSYNVYYGTAAGGENKLAGNVPMGTTSLTITAPPTTAGTVPSSNTSGLTVPTANTPTKTDTGGTIPAQTSYFKVTAVNSKGETTGSTEVSVVTTTATSTITITWGAIVNAFLMQGTGSVQTANITS